MKLNLPTQRYNMQYTNKPLLISSNFLEQFLADSKKSQALPENFQETAPLSYQTVNDVAVIRVHGPIVRYASAEQLFYGYCDIEDVKQLIADAVLELSIQGIVLSMDTPGGTADHIMELGLFIREMKKKKPIATHVEGGNFSAGYWISASTDFIYSDLSGESGSIGVVQAVYDTSKLFNNMGVNVKVMRSSPLKGAGIQGTEFTEEMQAEFKRGIDYLYGKFTSWVKENRPQVKPEAMNAQTYFAEEAKKMGLIDGIYSLEKTIEDVKLLARIRAPKPL